MILVEQRDALLAAGLRIGLEGALGGGDRLVDVGFGAERNLIHRFFGRRIDDGGGLLDGGIDPGAIDVELHAVDHRKPLSCGANGGGTERSAGILARKPGQLNPPYAGCRDAAGAEYRGDVKDGPAEEWVSALRGVTACRAASGTRNISIRPRTLVPRMQRSAKRCAADPGPTTIATPPSCGAAPGLPPSGFPPHR